MSETEFEEGDFVIICHSCHDGDNRNAFMSLDEWKDKKDDFKRYHEDCWRIE